MTAPKVMSALNIPMKKACFLKLKLFLINFTLPTQANAEPAPIRKRDTIDSKRERLIENKILAIDNVIRAKSHDFFIPILSMSNPAGI